jgi:hypothetical protein
VIWVRSWRRITTIVASSRVVGWVRRRFVRWWIRFKLLIGSSLARVALVLARRIILVIRVSLAVRLGLRLRRGELLRIIVNWSSVYFFFLFVWIVIVNWIHRRGRRFLISKVILLIRRLFLELLHLSGLH